MTRLEAWVMVALLAIVLIVLSISAPGTYDDLYRLHHQVITDMTHSAQ